MPHNFRKFRLFIITLTLALLSFGVGGQANLCFMPDGEVYLEQSPLACILDEGCGANNTVADQGHCLDVSPGGDASGHRHGNIDQQPLPAIVPPGPAILLARTDQQPSIAIQSIPPTQLALLQSVILLI